MTRVIFLIKRGPCPVTHRMPYHPVILCTRKHTAQWEAGDSGEGAWVWEHPSSTEGSGWLLVRWNGFDVDYGPVVHRIAMPDGTPGAFVHERDREPWTLLPGAVWWSDEPIPEWLSKHGAHLPEDEFSQGRILADAGTCLLPLSRQVEIATRRARRKPAHTAEDTCNSR